MENGQEEAKTESTNNVAEKVADDAGDKVKNATPIAGDANDVKETDEVKEDNEVKEENEEKKGNEKENDVKKEGPSPELLEEIKDQVEVSHFVLATN